MRSYLLVLLFFPALLPLRSAGQGLYRKAQQQRAEKQWDQALETIRRAAKAQPASATVQSTCGEWLYEAARYAEAAAVFEAASQTVPKGAAAFALPLARCWYRAGAPEAALRLLEAHPAAAATPEGKKLIAGARWAAGALANPAPVRPVSLGPRFNTQDPELFPQRSIDGQAFYFTRRVRGIDEDLCRALPDSCGGWFFGRPLPAPPNSPRQESALSLSADGHYLFFARGEVRSADGWTGGGADLYLAYMERPADTVWSQPLPFGATLNTPGFEGTPCLSADNRTLYFASDRPGGYGGLDLWCSRFERGLWSAPRNLGATVNTPGDETAPFICADDRTLFFASDGQVQSLGGHDLYRAERTSDTVWGAVRNLGAPVNSPYDEVSLTVTTAGDTAFFATDRDGPAGNFDLWSTPLPEAVRPTPSLQVRGKVQDSLTGERLDFAHLFLLDAADGRELGDFTANRGDGSFSLFLEPQHRYALQVIRPGYTAVTDTFSYDTLGGPEPFRGYALLPSDYVAPMSDTLLMILHFAKNSISLSDSARASLRTALAPFLAHDRAELVVNGYTDNTGPPLVNEQISGQRARSVGDAAEAAGFPAGRMQVQGWGEAQPLASNEEETGQALNRRVEVILRR